MTTSQFDSKGVQTDPYITQTRRNLIKRLQRYITVVSQYRLHLFTQYTQLDDFDNHEDLLRVRQQILNRFQWVISELEQTIERLQTHRISITDVEQSIDRPLIKEAIETSLNADFPSKSLSKTDEWQIYRRDLQETKEDLYILDLFVHRGISKIDRLMNVTNFYV